MTRTTLAARLVFFAATLWLAGCGGGGLLAGGRALITLSGGTATTGFTFAPAIRLDGSAGTVSGSCQISHSATGNDGVVIDLYGNSQASGRAIRALTIMGHVTTPTSGRITADLGGDTFTSTSPCTVTVTGLDEGRGNVSVTSSCQLAFGTGASAQTATADVSLDLSGCSVI